MKYILIILFSSISINLNAQQGISAGPRIQCGIWYDYDNAGNRIKRYYDCKDRYAHPDDRDDAGTPRRSPFVQGPANRGSQPNSTDDPFEGYDKVALYPNPVKDKFYIRLPQEGTHTHFHIYDAKGAIITSGNIDTRLYEGNLSNLPPGEYNIIVYYEDRSIPFKITKI